MAIITISRGSYSKGKEVAEAVAAKLGIECTSRDVMLDASDRFHVPEIKLMRAIHDAPSILDRLRHTKEAYIAYVRCALACRMAKGDLVYHGLAGHILLAGVPHLLKIRIIADMDQRVLAEMQKEQISDADARELLKKDDQERRRWTRSLHHADPWDSTLYDLVINIHRLSVGDAVDLIAQTTHQDPFLSTPSRQQRLDDFALACQVKAAIVDPFLDTAVTSEYGNVVIYHPTGDAVKRLKKSTADLPGRIDGVRTLEIHEGVEAPPDAV